MDNDAIIKALKVPYIKWYEINEMIENAKDEETKEALKIIRCQKRLLEQYSI